MTSKLKPDVLETVSGSGTIALTNQLSGMTSASVPSGSVLQVLGIKTLDATATTSNTYVNTGITLAITPSSTSSKILVNVNCAGCGTQGHSSAHMGLKIFRDSTDIIKFEGQGGYNGVATEDSGGYSCSYLDSPSSTSAVTYMVKLANVGNVGTCRLGHSSGVSTITLMEIKG
jgi:hypothetical protein